MKTATKRATKHERRRAAVKQVPPDPFGELPRRKRDARRAAEALGHSLRTWHRRPNDPAGRWNAFCERCNRLAVTCVEAPEGFPSHSYGSALRERCRRES